MNENFRLLTVTLFACIAAALESSKKRTTNAWAAYCKTSKTCLFHSNFAGMLSATLLCTRSNADRDISKSVVFWYCRTSQSAFLPRRHTLPGFELMTTRVFFFLRFFVLSYPSQSCLFLVSMLVADITEAPCSAWRNCGARCVAPAAVCLAQAIVGHGHESCQYLYSPEPCLIMLINPMIKVEPTVDLSRERALPVLLSCLADIHSYCEWRWSTLGCILSSQNFIVPHESCLDALCWFN